MRTPSRTDWWLCAVFVAFLVASASLFNEVHNQSQHSAQNEQFSKVYWSAMDDLRSATESVGRKFLKNDTVVIEIKNPSIPDSGEAPKKPDPIILQGISWQEDTPLAMINGKIYQVGDRIGDSTLDEIKASTIRLGNADGTGIEIKLMKDVAP